MSDLDQLTRLRTLQDEVQRLRDQNVQLRLSSAIWIRLYEAAYVRAGGVLPDERLSSEGFQ